MYQIQSHHNLVSKGLFVSLLAYSGLVLTNTTDIEPKVFDRSIPANSKTPTLNIAQQDRRDSKLSNHTRRTSHYRKDMDKEDSEPRMNLPSADATRTRAQHQSGVGMGYDDVFGEGVTTTGPQSPVIEIGGSTLASMLCKNGDIRFVNNIVKTSTWILPEPIPPRVEVSPEIPRGEHAVEGVENVFEPIAALANLPPIPTTDLVVGTVARVGKAVGVAAKVGDAGAKAAKRWADENENKSVDLRVSIYRMQVDVQCSAAQICIEHQWQDAGLKSKDEKRKPLMPPLRGFAYHIYGHEVPGKVRALLSNGIVLQKALAAYQADPCANAPGTSTDGGGGPSISTSGGSSQKNCQPILDEIKIAKARLKKVTKAHADAQVKVLELKRDKNQAELDRIDEKKAVEKQIPGAEEAVEKARGKMERANAKLEKAAQKRNVDTKFLLMLNNIVKKYRAKLNTVKDALENLRNQLKAIDAKYNAKIAALNAKIVTVEAKVKRLAKEKASLRSEIDALWNKYNQCLGQ